MIDTPQGRFVLYLRDRLQVLADQDRDAAYAEDAERSVFTMKDVQPGYQFKGHGGDTRIVVKVSERYVGVDTSYISRTGEPMFIASFVKYLNENKCFRKIAP